MRLLAALLLGSVLAAAAHAADPAAERARIRGERAAAEQRYAEAERACQSRFAVNACLDAARAERRGVLDRLRREELVLDEAERRQRAAERSEEIRTRQRERAAAPPPSTARIAAEIASAPPRLQLRQRPGAAPRESHRLSPEEEARNRAAYAERQQQAERHRADAERRRAERHRGKPPAAPLPVPSAASAGRP